MKLSKLFTTFTATLAFAAVGHGSDYSLLGKNYVTAGVGTTVFDQGTAPLFQNDREYSFDAALSGNWNLAPNFDAGLVVDYSRLTGNVAAPAVDVRLENITTIVRGNLFGEATPNIRPFVGPALGLVHSRLRVAGDSDSENAFIFGLGGGVEYMMFERTALRFSVDWRHIDSLSFDNGPDLPKSQSIFYTVFASHHFTEQVFGIAEVSFENSESNNTSFLIGAGWRL